MTRRHFLATTVGLLTLLFLVSAFPNWRPSALQRERRAMPPVSGGPIRGVQVAAVGAARVHFGHLAELEAARPAPAGPPTHVTLPDDEYEEPESPFGELITHGPLDSVPSPEVPSPSATSSFQGLDDIPGVGTGSYIIPPDTDGAVGPTRIFNTLNNNYRILNKADGTIISTVSMNSFWSGTGATGLFDPRTLYDPYRNRFIVAAVSNSVSSSSSLVIGVSNSSDPAGTWTLVRYPLGATLCNTGESCWADYPTLGFNQKWIAVSVNMFGNADGSFLESRVNVFNYATLRAGSTPADNVFVTSADFTIHPVATYSSTESTLYAPAHVSSASAWYRLNTITGTADVPVYTQSDLKTHTLIGSWTPPGSQGNPGLPQGANPSGAASGTVDPGDARIMNAIFRNNAIWYAQTIALPAGGIYTHTAAQWVKLDTTGADLDAGRVEDPTATSTNGGKWYAYPSIAVNANGDALLGFSEFSSSEYPSAAYSYRTSADAAGTMRDPVVAKAGLGYYYKTFSGSRNRWGDYSATQVDPSDDLSMWTVQEYANGQGSTSTSNPNGSYWSTWWVKVAPPAAVPNPAMALDSPATGSTPVQPFTLMGWAIDRGATSGTGVDTLHVWAYPSNGSPQFVGVATYGASRSDVGTVYGSQFTNSGFSLSVAGLAPGTYTIVASAYSTVVSGFNQSRSAVVTIPTSSPAMGLDTPANGSTLAPSFSVAGWAVDRVASSGSGVDAVHVYAFPRSGSGFGVGIFLGAATLGLSRPDVGAVFGSQFNNSGYSVQASGLALGSYRVIAYAHSSVAGAFNQSQSADITVSASPAMALDTPTGGTQTQPFFLAGWAVDRAASSGTGVDAVHVWAFPVSGGAALFAGEATLGSARPDVGAVFGSQFTNSGYGLTVSGLPAGSYALGVYAHSTVTGEFNQSRFVTISIQ